MNTQSEMIFLFFRSFFFSHSKFNLILMLASGHELVLDLLPVTGGRASLAGALWRSSCESRFIVAKGAAGCDHHHHGTLKY